jgi:nanoRNase/pAp phosphatase (c-di-AMP/oligoRNAs hydrolase)
VTEPVLEPDDAVVVLDAPSTSRVAPVDPTGAGALYLVDHHTPGDLARATTASVVEPDAASTAELVSRVVDAGGWERSATAATALLAGVLSDTDFLADAGAEQVEYVTDLFVDARGNEAAVASLFPPAAGDGARMAVFKSVIRADGYGAGETVIATTRVGAEEAAAAALLEVGADAAFAVSDQGDHARLVGRCTETFAAELSLGGELLPSLSADGGGHDTAGTVRLSDTSPAAAASAVVEEIERRRGVTFGTVE